MAAFVGKFATPEITLTPGVKKTILQVKAPGAQRVKILSWGVFFKGATSTDTPVYVELLTQTSAGTMTVGTPTKNERDIIETLQTSFLHSATDGLDPVPGSTLEKIEVHPQTGYQIIYPMGHEPILSKNERVGILVLSPASVTVVGEMTFEE